MKKRSHTIQRQKIEVYFDGLDNGVGMQDRIAEIFYLRIQPKMNLLFDDIADDKHLLSLDKLEIDCGVLSNKNWEDEWVDNTLRKLSEELRTKHRMSLAGNPGINEEAEQMILFFIENGHLPWNSSIATLNELTELTERFTQISKLFESKLRSVFRANNDLIKRCVVTFSETFIDNVIGVLVNKNSEQWLFIESFYLAHKTIRKSMFAEAVLRTYSVEGTKNGEENVLLHFISHMYDLADEITKKEIEQVSMEKFHIKPGALKENKASSDRKRKSNGDAIYLHNAGLVLLHPFLSHLFEMTGLTVKNEWKDDRSVSKAIRALHYLVNGDNEFAEFNYPLNKILCGLQPEDFISDEEDLSIEIKTSCDALLIETIGYWVQLKNTGIDGFREAFLRRKGKLSVSSNGWLLQPEQKPIDVLLTHLPWGIGIVKLPWMKELLYTEW